MRGTTINPPHPKQRPPKKHPLFFNARIEDIIETSHPKAFLSHASEDKDRFVIPFATALRAAGIDAWVDRWEIKPGDSLVQKIFDDGIEKANAALIVLSAVSVNKPWVREELDSAFVAKVERRLRLIPVIIDHCEIPAPLKHLKYLRIKNLSDFGNEVGEITRALYDRTDKPPLGAPPPYSAIPLFRIPGITDSDSKVLQAIGQTYLSRGRGPVGRKQLEELLAPERISPSLLEESLDVLEGEHLISAQHAIGTRSFAVKLTSFGAEKVFAALVPNMAAYEKQIAASLVNGTHNEAKKIAEDLEIPYAVVEFFLSKFESRQLIKAIKHFQGMMVVSVSARLKRAVTE